VGLLVGLSAAFLSAVWFDVSPFLRGPAPYPPEWRWPFHAERAFAWSGMLVSAGAALVILLWLSGREWALRSPRRSAASILAAATVVCFALQIGFLGLGDSRSPWVRLAERTINRWHTGYYTVAVSPVARDPLRFLRDHAEILPTLPGQVEHAHTRPPGAVLFFRGALAVCEGWPALTRTLTDVLRDGGLEAAIEAPAHREARVAAALLAPLLILAIAAATCWPIALLARSFRVPPLEAARIGALWGAVPASALMLPQLDQLVTFCTVLSIGLLSAALARPRAGLDGRALSAGVIAGVAAMLSYGSGVFLAFGGLIAVAVHFEGGRSASSLLRPVALASSVALACHALPVLVGHDPIASFRAAMSTHFGVYTLRRSYRLWVLFNLWDLAVFLAIPIAWLGVLRVGESLASLRRAGGWMRMAPIDRAPVAAAALLVALDLSGMVRGEIGRSWMPIMPFLLVAATTRANATAARCEGAGPSAALAVLLAGLLLVHAWVLRLCWQ